MSHLFLIKMMHAQKQKIGKMHTKNVSSPVEGGFISHFHLNLNFLTYQVVYGSKKKNTS